MATLEKIRKKSALLFTIIIVALLAFILGDFLTSGRSFFGHGTTMAKVAGHKVDYQQVSERVEQLSQQAQAQGQDVDGETLRQMAIQQLLSQQLLDEEIASLGITVTDAEITAGLTGPIPHPAAQQFIYQMSQQLGLPAMSGQAVFDAVSNPAKYGINDPQIVSQLRALWAAQEMQVEEALKQDKFSRLLAGLYTANTIDADDLYTERNTTTRISYAAKDFTSIPDSEVEVSDADIRNEWSKNKERYRLDEDNRAVSYIIVPIEPSAQDIRNAEIAVADAIATLRADSTGVSSLQGNSAFVINRTSTPRRGVQNALLSAYLDSARVGQVAELIHNNTGYTLAKLIGKTMETDSVRISFALFEDAETRDSVMGRIKAGELTLSAYIAENPGVGQDSIWDTMVGNQAPAQLNATIAAAPYGQIVAYSDSVMTQDGTFAQRYMAINVINRRPAVPVYDVAIIEYAVDPSSETINTLTSDLRKFLTDNNTAEAFVANAAEAGYNVQSGLVSASLPQLGINAYGRGIDDSRALVKWAMEAKKGQVSPIYQDKRQNYLAAIAVNDLYEDYIPYDAPAVKEALTAQVLSDKKAGKLIEQYSGKASDVKGYADLMGTEVAKTEVNFASPMFGNLGFNETTLQGALGAASKGALVGPVQGNTRVVVMFVDDIVTEGRPNEFVENAAEFNRTQGFQAIFTAANLFNVLRGKNTVTNYSLDFENPGL